MLNEVIGGTNKSEHSIRFKIFEHVIHWLYILELKLGFSRSKKLCSLKFHLAPAIFVSFIDFLVQQLFIIVIYFKEDQLYI